MAVAILERGMTQISPEPSHRDEDIPGVYKDLARIVRGLTRGMASRVAARRANVSYNTILRMMEGDRPSVDTILRFAQGFNVDPGPLLQAAGYPIASGAIGNTCGN